MNLYILQFRKNKFSENQEEVIVDGKFTILDDETIEKVLDFGEIEE